MTAENDLGKCDDCGTPLMDCGPIGVECPNRECPGNRRIIRQVHEAFEARRTSNTVTDEARGEAAYALHLASGRHIDMPTARMLSDAAINTALKWSPSAGGACTCGPSDIHMECPAHGAGARSSVETTANPFDKARGSHLDGHVLIVRFDSRDDAQAAQNAIFEGTTQVVTEKAAEPHGPKCECGACIAAEIQRMRTSEKTGEDRTLGKRKERCPHGISHLNVCTKCD